MSKNSLKNKLILIIKREIKEKNITDKDGINTKKNWDSIGNLNILLTIESDLKIIFNTKKFNSLNNFQSILKNVQKKFDKKKT